MSSMCLNPGKKRFKLAEKYTPIQNRGLDFVMQVSCSQAGACVGITWEHLKNVQVLTTFHLPLIQCFFRVRPEPGHFQTSSPGECHVHHSWRTGVPEFREGRGQGQTAVWRSFAKVDPLVLSLEETGCVPERQLALASTPCPAPGAVS